MGSLQKEYYGVDLMNRYIKGLLNLEVHVTEHCNLNCKGCFHYSPLAKPAFLDIIQYEKDMKRLSELFYNEAEYINLMGGEPLLNPDIIKIMKITRQYFKHSLIRIVTNGIMLNEMSDEFWRECQINDISVEPTEYPIGIDLESISEKAENFGVKYKIYHSASTMSRQPLAINGEYDCTENFDKCPQANNWIQLRNGKLFTCITAAHIQNLIGEFDLKIHISDKNYVDIYEAKSADEILERLASPIPLCRFCNLDGSVNNVPYSKTQKSRYEWMDFEFKKDDIRYLKDKSVFVFGAGYYGHETVRRLTENNISIKNVLVTSKVNNPDTVGTVKVIEIADTAALDHNIPVLIAVNRARQDVYNTILKYGFSEPIFVTWPN